MSDATWIDLDIDDLRSNQRQAYEDYKVAQRSAAKLREEFERTMTEGEAVPSGMRLAFNYRFGKLSTALVADDKKQAKPKQAKLSLSAYLALQQA